MPPTKPPPPRRNRPGTADVTVKSENTAPSTPSSTLATATRPVSLGSRTTPGGGSVSAGSTTNRRSFLPKQVQRRSKEERDKSAPTASKIAPVVVPTASLRGRGGGRGDRGGASRGRGRGGRGRGRFEPIATQAVGAFSSIGAYDGRSRAGPAFEIRGTASTGQDISGVLKGDGDDGTEDGNAFNMTRSLGVDIDEFFPIRPMRGEEKVESDPASGIKAEEEDDYSDHYEEMELEVEDPDAPRIKSEPGSRAVSSTPSTKTITVSRKVRSKSATPFVLPPSKQDTYVSPEELVELKRVARDHKTISKEFNILAPKNRSSATPGVEIESKTATPEPSKAGDNEEEAPPEIEQKLFFFQMPVLCPKFEAPPSEPDSTIDVEVTDSAPTRAKPSSNNPEPADASPTLKYPPGLAGKLRVHASGKLTMLLGDIVMEVSQGTEANFLQDIVAFDPADQKAFLIGQVSRKMIVAPDIEMLLQGMSGLNMSDSPQTAVKT